MAFARTCNFACSYCNASFSTTWAKDIKTAGPYQNLVSDGARAFQQDGDWAQPYASNEENPYIQAFWKWWPELATTLQELRVTGGEPLMSPDVWKLLEYFKQHGPKNLLFSLNSNLGAGSALIDKLIDYSKHIPSFDLYTSGEAFGTQGEYIRDGLSWEHWAANVERILSEGDLRAFHVMMTINGLCLFSITDFLDFLMECKRRYGRHKPSWSVNILRFPSFMSPLTLPDHIREERRRHLAGWLANHANHPLITELEYAGLARLVDYLEVVKTPHSRVSGQESQRRDFKSFYRQYDRRRGKDFRAVFPPALVEWFDSIEETDLGYGQALVSGDATHGWKRDKDLKRLAEKEGWCLDPQDANPGSVDYKGAGGPS